MRVAPSRLVAVAGTAALIAITWNAVSATGQLPESYQPQRTSSGQPDLNGFWQALNTANWDIEEHGAAPSPYPTMLGAYLAQPPGYGVVQGGTIPYRPEALARRKTHMEKRLVTDPLLTNNIDEDTADPEAKCFQGGVPRATYMPHPFQIVQTADKVFIAYQFGGISSRVVHVAADGDLAKARQNYLLDINSWMGQSVGRWEGNTFVAEAKWFSGPTVWLDRAGNYYGMNATVTERYTPISPFHMQYEATIDDPETFTRPWSIAMPLYKIVDPSMELLEFQCVAFAEEFMYHTLKRKP